VRLDGGLTRFASQRILFCSDFFPGLNKDQQIRGVSTNHMPFHFADFREQELMAVAAVMAGLSVLGFRKH
jgi:hypothetical protein